MNGDQLRAIRHYLEYTQQEMSDYIGVSLATIASIEAGHRVMSDNVRWKIAHKFDTNNEDFQQYIERREKVDKYFN